MKSAIDHAQHTPFSDPGSHAALLADVPSEPAALSGVARNLIVHYRSSGHELPPETRDDINARWLEAILDLDQSRHLGPLAGPRPIKQRVQGCCRDHTLFCVGALRSQGIPARSRVGFAGYFLEGWNHDHVIVEAWLDGRWQRFDPEIEEPRPSLPTPMDIGTCAIGSNGFVTAAQAWSAHREGELGSTTYGVDPSVPFLSGERFLFNEVIIEVAHRFGDELLLWDTWGRMGFPDQPANAEDLTWVDAIAELLLASDDGDEAAEDQLLEQYRSDDGLHLGPTVSQESPYGDLAIEIVLD